MVSSDTFHLFFFLFTSSNIKIHAHNYKAATAASTQKGILVALGHFLYTFDTEIIALNFEHKVQTQITHSKKYRINLHLMLLIS